MKTRSKYAQRDSVDFVVQAGEYRRSELRDLDATISARYHWSVARQLTPFHYVIGISGILPYNRNVTLQTLELFSAFARLYNAAASPASRLRSAGSLATSRLCESAVAHGQCARLRIERFWFET